MKIRTLLLLLVLAAVAGFAALNWNAFMTPTTLSVGVAMVQAPLGLVMLGLLIALTAVFLVFVVYLQTSVLVDARRHARELRVNRELADQAEASRFTELRSFLESELKRQAESDAASRSAVLARLEQLDRDSHSAFEQLEASIYAYLGEFEDRIEKRDAQQSSRST